MERRRHPTVEALSLVLALAIASLGCERPGAISASIAFDDTATLTKCVTVEVQDLEGATLATSDPIPRDTREELVLAIYQGKTFPETINLRAQGFADEACSEILEGDQLEQSEWTQAVFVRTRVSPVVLTVLGSDNSGPPPPDQDNDGDNDGHDSAISGGDDCDDSDPEVFSRDGGETQCSDSKDNDCDGRDDCADPHCNQQACATGSCSGLRCESPDGGCSCSDGNSCTIGDTCQAGGGCVGGTPVVCTPADECHAALPACTANGSCQFQITPGTPCTGGVCDSAGTCIANSTFPFGPSNFSPSVPVGTQSFVIDCDATINTGGTNVLMTAGPGCPPLPPYVKVTQTPSSIELIVFYVDKFEIKEKKKLRITGTRPVAFAVNGDVDIAGVLDVSANLSAPGVSGSAYCGGNGTGGTASSGAIGPVGVGYGGGGGGGYSLAGGNGGDGGINDKVGGGRKGAAGGVINGTATLTPIRGGCSGGAGAGTVGKSGQPGAGGGAIQITASGEISVSGRILAGGGGGAAAIGDYSGAGGGGSGGSILLEADTIDLTGGVLVANGGGGGQGAGANPGHPGLNGLPSADPAPGGQTDGGAGFTTIGGAGGFGGALTHPEDGETFKGGGGGGGGSAGRIYIRASKGCTYQSTIVSPKAQSSVTSCVSP